MVLGYVRTTYGDVRGSTTGKGTVVPWYGLMVASQCEKLNGWSLGVKAQVCSGTEVAPDRVPESTQGEDTGRRGTRVRHGHSYENQDG